MQLNEYQAKAITTALPNAFKLEYLVPGLGGEVGEVQEVLNGSYESQHEFRQALISELGDIYWFIALTCHYFNWQLEDIILGNFGGDFKEYQEIVDEKVEDGPFGQISLAFSLSTAAGNAQSAFAKAVRDDNGTLSEARLSKFRVSLEDTFYYTALLAKTVDASVVTLMEKNISKLFDRKDRGVLGGSGNNR